MKSLCVRDQVDRVYLETHRLYETLDQYFRNLTRILEFVDRSSVPEPKFYAELLKAQLSAYELVILFYHCLSTLADKTLKPLVEKFSFLEKLDEDKLIDASHADLYQYTAYGKRIDEIITRA